MLHTYNRKTVIEYTDIKDISPAEKHYTHRHTEQTPPKCTHNKKTSANSHLWQWHLLVKQPALGHRALRTQTSWTQESRTRASNTHTSPKQISSTGHFNHLFIDFNHQINHCFNDLNHSFIYFNHWFIYYKLWYIDFDQWLIDFKRWFIYFNQ